MTDNAAVIWAAFDLETTGVDVENDRIVSACVGLAEPGTWEPTEWLVNPGVTIPQGAIDVHGITNEKVQTGEDPGAAVESIAGTLTAAWGVGAPVTGWNLCYDLTLLDREMQRHLGRRLEVTGPVLDGMVIDKQAEPFRKGSRSLAAVAAHYGVPLDGAHNSTADAFAALRTTWQIIYRWFPDATHADLHKMQIDAYRKQRESFAEYLHRQGKTLDNDNTVWPVQP